MDLASFFGGIIAGALGICALALILSNHMGPKS